MKLTRRGWMASIGSIAASLGGLYAAGIRPRFRGRYCIAGASKKVALGPQGLESVVRKGDLCCLVIGDWGSGRPLQRQVADGMQAFAYEAHPQFIISVGDNFYPSGVKSVDDPLWKSVFEDVYVGENLQIPWYSSFGNHDVEGDVPAQLAYHEKNPRWNFPSNYYVFSRSEGNVTADFFVLDTESLVTGQDAAQLQWLEQQLEQSTALWKICVGHRPIRSNGHYGGESYLQNHLKPILDHHGVAAYLCGHDHDLQLLKNPADRFLCVVSGAGGKARDSSYGHDTLYAGTNGGFVALSLSPTELTASALNAFGEVEFVERCLCLETALARR